MPWLSNPQLAENIVLLGAFLMLMLVSAAFEIVMIARKRHLTAAMDVWGYPMSCARCCSSFRRSSTAACERSCGAASHSLRSASGDAALVGREYGAELRPESHLWRTAGLCAAVRAGRRHRSAPGQPPLVRRGVEVRRRNLRHLRGRLPADSAGRSDHDVGGQRHDGEDGRGRARTSRRDRARALAPHDDAARAADLPAGRRADADGARRHHHAVHRRRTSPACRFSWRGR